MFDAFQNAKVLCIGDVMLDEYVYGSVDRISPEAPIPILQIKSESVQLGGAGNTALNIAALGASCTFMSIVGTDSIGKDILRLVGAQWPLIKPCLINDTGRASIQKTRFVAGSQQILRVDRERIIPITDGKSSQLGAMLDEMIPEHDVLVISDYNKGLLTPALLGYTIRTAQAFGKKIIVDPKLRDPRLYKGASIITPNRAEFDYMTTFAGIPLDMVMRARRLMKQCELEAVLITRSEEGMSLIESGTDQHFAAAAHEIVDVSGAGDTVVAVLAVALAADLPLWQAAQLSNIAAGLAVAKRGTATVSLQELRKAYEKIQTRLH